MSRRNISKKRFPEFDPIYNSYLVNLFILRVLKSGKKNLAQKIVYKTFDIIKIKTNKNPLYIFEKAVKNITPLIQVKTKRIGGTTHQIPSQINKFKAITLALRWLIKYANDRSGKTISIKLAFEIIDAFNRLGNSIKKKEEIHKIAKTNKSFVYNA
jgi:small subunit ribosomal protein S7